MDARAEDHDDAAQPAAPVPVDWGPGDVSEPA
jgi:hypothetical protein